MVERWFVMPRGAGSSPASPVMEGSIRSLMVEQQPSKLLMWVRFPPNPSVPFMVFFKYFYT